MDYWLNSVYSSFDGLVLEDILDMRQEIIEYEIQAALSRYKPVERVPEADAWEISYAAGMPCCLKNRVYILTSLISEFEPYMNFWNKQYSKIRESSDARALEMFLDAVPKKEPANAKDYLSRMLLLHRIADFSKEMDHAMRRQQRKEKQGFAGIVLHELFGSAWYNQLAVIMRQQARLNSQRFCVSACLESLEEHPTYNPMLYEPARDRILDMYRKKGYSAAMQFIRDTTKE